MLSLLLSFLFSVSYGAIFVFLTRLSKRRAVNRTVTAILLFLTALCYMVEFFVYRSFKVFYDVETVLNGAGGVASGFMGDVGRLVFCYDGISRIVLFLLPLLLYLIFCRQDPASRLRLRDGVLLLGTAALLFASAVFATNLSAPYRLMYGEEYSFASVVEAYGLGTGLRLEVKRYLVGEQYSFTQEAEKATDKNDTPVRNWAEAKLPTAEQERIAKAVSHLNEQTEKGSDEQASYAIRFFSEVTLPGAEHSALFQYLNTDNSTQAIQEAKADGHVGNVELSVGAETVLNTDTEATESESGLKIDSDTATTEETGAFPGISGGEYVFQPSGEYGVNALPIDFASLADTTSGTARELDLYVDSLTPSSKNAFTGLFAGKNLIFFSAEAFSGDLIDPELTPTLYRLANRGICFTDYYQPAIAGTTGGEYANLFGLLPTSGGKSMKLITEQNTWITIGNRLNEQGYYGRAFHNNTYTIYGRDETHERLGYSDGFLGVGNGMEEYLHIHGFPASDLEMLQGTLPTYLTRRPFNVYYMTVSGHGQYGRSINQMSAKNYHRVESLPYSEIVKCYLANNLELEDALSYLVEELEKAGIADDTVIVLSADHFPYGLDNDAALGNMPYLSELYGYNVTNYLQRDHNRLIIWSGCLEKGDPVVISSPTFSLDILPTLCNLFDVEFDSRLLPGRDVFSDKEALIFNGGYDWKTDLGTYIASKNEFTPASEDTVIPEGYVSYIKGVVRDKRAYCAGVLECGYFNHVFGEP